ncbi:REP element-mobilizing transposase RayT [Mucilaginibacter yixingensis]|uniref:REP element-mobilizing transposase RayT n=1 Tax=Mucilaginibacter yixingensis TaxID=1295612 RepID=A0A2T5J8F6_9SPHI|nr:IS200/IS605 family transposase [Mucilaginibacter yixingensis]PTQ95741.1 REP element-mobilizing transposase RayT [Mucilaginibacter yixingensis]
MANTYTQLYVHIIFAVKGRENLIGSGNREELHKYISGIVEKRGQKLLAVFCMPDHTHLLVGLKGDISVSDLVRDVKAGSSGFINDQRWVRGKFNWQEGYGAFSYSKSQLDTVINYVLNQEKHHGVRSFKDEYLELLHRFEVEYDERYLFEWYV